MLVYVELNRPGRIIPGTAGLLVALLACGRLSEAHPRAVGLLVLSIGAVLLGMGLVKATGEAVSVAATAMLVVGFRLLVMPPVGWMMCILCGVAIGGATTALTRVARRARANKANPAARKSDQPIRASAL